MESPITMTFHGAAIAAALYIIMVSFLGQPVIIAQTRSIFIGLLAALYMIVFGHKAPSMARINPALI